MAVTQAAGSVSDEIKIAEDFSLDLHSHLINRGLAILGMRGSGKSWTAGVVAEELASKGIPFIIIDLMGEYKTLREKFPVLIAALGSPDYADLKGLTPESAGTLAEKIVNMGISLILDLKYGTMLDRYRVLASFLEGLYYTEEKVARPYVLIMDEAHRITPEKGVIKLRGVREAQQKIEYWVYEIGASLDYNEPVLVMKNGTVMMLPIGELVDRYFEKDDWGRRYVDDLQVPSMNPKNGQIKWKKVAYVFRRPVPDVLVRLHLETGREVTVTEHHSIFVLEDGEIKPKKVSDIREGDIVLIAKRIPPCPHSSLHFINLVESFLALPKELTKNMLISNVPAEVFIRHWRAIKEYSRIYAYPSNVRYKWKIRRQIPLALGHLLSTKDLRQCNVGGVPCLIPADSRLARLLGYFVAEGSLIERHRDSYAVCFALGSEDKRVIKDIQGIVKSLFNKEAHVTRPSTRPNTVQVTINSKVILLLFKYVLRVQTGACNKAVPSIIFHMPNEFKKEFIKAWYYGDAGTTVSKRLKSDILYLFAHLGVIGSFYHKEGRLRTLPGGYLSSSDSFNLSTPIPTRSFHNLGHHEYPPTSAFRTVLRLLAGNPENFKGHPSYSAGCDRIAITPRALAKILTPRRQKRLHRLAYLFNWTTAGQFAKNVGIDLNSAYHFLERWRNKGVVQRIGRRKNYRYKLTELGEKFLHQISLLKQLVRHSDVGFVRVTRVERRNPSGNFVYDLSVPNYESFIGGWGGVICHNTGRHYGLGFIAVARRTAEISKMILTQCELKIAHKVVDPIDLERLREYGLPPDMLERIKQFKPGDAVVIGLEEPKIIHVKQRICSHGARTPLAKPIETPDLAKAVKELTNLLKQPLHKIEKTEGEFASQLKAYEERISELEKVLKEEKRRRLELVAENETLKSEISNLKTKILAADERAKYEARIKVLESEVSSLKEQLNKAAEIEATLERMREIVESWKDLILETGSILGLELIPNDIQSLIQERDELRKKLEVYEREEALKNELVRQTLTNKDVRSWILDAESLLRRLSRKGQAGEVILRAVLRMDPEVSFLPEEIETGYTAGTNLNYLNMLLGRGLLWESRKKGRKAFRNRLYQWVAENVRRIMPSAPDEAINQIAEHLKSMVVK